jgi:AraC-like DNA-binding protein
VARPIDPTERAHLRDREGFSPPVHRFAPAPELADVVRRYWLPVWDLPPGVTTAQRVLQYPVVIVVVTADYAHVVGPSTGLSTRHLSGRGWAVGAMCQPAAGVMITGAPVSRLTDQVLDLAEAPGLAGARLTTDVRAAMAADPADSTAQGAAVALLEAAMAALGPVDEEGLLVNAIVEHVENDSTVQRVAQVAQKFALSERTLQRLCARRLGLSPKWLVQRRRLHEAAGLLRSDDPPDLARVALELGYADQAHFTNDFRTVTGLTPGEFAAEPRPS